MCVQDFTLINPFTLQNMKKEKLGQTPAFPNVEVGSLCSVEEGMSKRFYAACAAMNGMLAHSTRYHCRKEDGDLTWKQGMIKESYELADELLKKENDEQI